MTTSADSDSTADAERAGPRQGIQSVELAMTVIEALESGLGPMSLTQIANASGMAASKVHRYLVSLGRAGLVVQSHRSGWERQCRCSPPRSDASTWPICRPR